PGRRSERRGNVAVGDAPHPDIDFGGQEEVGVAHPRVVAEERLDARVPLAAFAVPGDGAQPRTPMPPRWTRLPETPREPVQQALELGFVLPVDGGAAQLGTTADRREFGELGLERVLQAMGRTRPQHLGPRALHEELAAAHVDARQTGAHAPSTVTPVATSTISRRGSVTAAPSRPASCSR